MDKPISIDKVLRQFLKSKRIIYSLPVAILLVIAVSLLRSGRNTSHISLDESEPKKEHFDVFITSSYYYPTSKSLGDNAVSLVFAGSTRLADEQPRMRVRGWNGTGHVETEGRVERITRAGQKECRWVPYLLTVQTLPGMTHLEIGQGDGYAKIPFYRPRSRPRAVVSCIAPLFAAEQWQAMVFAIHTYRRFGSYAHVYARSVVAPYFDLLKAYEKEDYLTLQPWLKMRLSSIPEDVFEPNEHVEFRNQAAAQTDCLLQYKESASFISFVDFDDVLIPRLGKTYLEEYTHLFNSRPNIAYLHYAKENVKVKASRDPSKFHLQQMYSSIVFDQVTETGKTVADPRHVNATWIHWPLHLQDGWSSYGVETEKNAITHLKYVDKETSPVPSSFPHPAYEPATLGRNASRHLVGREDMEAMHADFTRMWNHSDLRSTIDALPQKPFYFNIILKCYNSKFYNPYHSGQDERKQENKCPGPEMCELPPSPGIDCANSHAEFFSSAKGELFTVHYAVNKRFLIGDGCI